MNHKKYVSTALLLAGAVLFFSSSIFGQETQNYSGPFKVEKYAGNANYNYVIVEGDTLLQGAFKMHRSSLESLLNHEDSSFLFQGTFDNNYPSGKWIFQFGEYKSDKKSQLVDYQYRVNINGVQEEAKGKIEEGRPDGKWLYSVNQIKDSEIEKTTFKSSITFDKGVPQKDFSIENEESTLVGRFLRSGIAHDQWSLFSNSANGANEDWTFSNGILKSIEVKGVKSKHISVFNTKNKNTKTIRLNKRFLKAIALQLTLKGNETVYHGGIEQLLAQNVKYYNKIDGILSKIGESHFLPEFNVKVPYYPLDSIETIRINEISRRFASAKSISTDLLTNTQLNILKLSDSESFYLYNVVDTITNQLVNPLEKMVAYYQENIFEFVPRTAILENIWQGQIPSTEITVANDITDTNSRQTFKLPNATLNNFDDNLSLSQIAEVIAYAEKSLLHIQEIVLQKVTREQRQQELIAIEEQLISQNNAISKYIDSTTVEIDKKYALALSAIKTASKKQLSAYAALGDDTNKLEEAKVILNCNKTYQNLASSIAYLPFQVDSIQRKYLDRVWNPFTATLMNEEVKKHITNAYIKILVPHFLQQSQNDLNCKRAKELIGQIKTSYTKIMALREKDTHKLERKLKREQDPKIIMALFNTNKKTEDH